MNSSTASQTDFPARDPEALDRLRRFGGAKLLNDMITLFLEAVPQRLSAARDGLAQDDPHAVEQALHALKSSAAQLGALRMQRLCQEGEQLARAGTLEGTPDIMAQLDDEEHRVRAWLSGVRAAEDR